MTQTQSSAAMQPTHVMRVGIIGMGGFAGVHHDAIHKLETEGRCKLICTCDPNPANFDRTMAAWQFSPRGVQVFDDYLNMLDACKERLDVVIIPTPVPLHAEMHRACIERGMAVYLEKPPTLNDAELNEMLAVEPRAAKQTNVGFNFIVEQPRQELKRRLLSGEFGRLQKVCFTGLWPRARAYFQRAAWAGRLMLDGRLVLDSCMGNAMAHYVHNVLFWAGADSLFTWADAQQVEAELYRAHAIEGADTMFVKAYTAQTIELQMALTHACDGAHRHREWLVCENAIITYVTGKHYKIDWHSNEHGKRTGRRRRRRGKGGDLRQGTSETYAVPAVSVRENLLAYFDYLRGLSDRPATRLIDTRPFVRLNDLAYVAAGTITTVPPQHINCSPTEDGASEYVAIQDIDNVFDQFFATGHFPSAQGLSWARAGGSAMLGDLPELPSVIEAMVA